MNNYDHFFKLKQEWQDNNKDTIIKIGNLVRLAFTENKESSDIYPEYIEYMWMIVLSVDLENRVYKGMVVDSPKYLRSVKEGDAYIFSHDEIGNLLPDSKSIPYGFQEKDSFNLN